MNIEDIFDDLPSLKTNRIILRRLTLEDVNDVFEYACEPEVAIYTLWEHHKSIDDTLTFLSFMVKKYEEKQVADWGIVLKESNKLIGTGGFMWWSPKNASAEVGYALSKKYWNQGIMTEALNEIVKFGFDKMKLNRIEAKTRVENIASQSVLKKAGMTFEGIMREQLFTKGDYRDFMIFSILRKEYIERTRES